MSKLSCFNDAPSVGLQVLVQFYSAWWLLVGGQGRLFRPASPLRTQYTVLYVRARLAVIPDAGCICDTYLVDLLALLAKLRCDALLLFLARTTQRTHSLLSATVKLLSRSRRTLSITVW